MSDWMSGNKQQKRGNYPKQQNILSYPKETIYNTKFEKLHLSLTPSIDDAPMS